MSDDEKIPETPENGAGEPEAQDEAPESGDARPKGACAGPHGPDSGEGPPQNRASAGRGAGTAPLEKTPDPLGELIAAIDSELEAGDSPVPEVAPAEPEAALRRHLLFSLAGDRYALPLDRVVELGLPPATTPLPNVPDWVRGVANLRGDVLAVVDLADFLGLDAASDRPAVERLLVVRAGHEEATAGLLVDGVHGKADLGPPGTPTAQVTDRVAAFLAGVSEHENRLVAVLDLDRFFTSSEVRQFQPA